MNINANEIQFMNRKFMKLREETNPEQKMRADEPTTVTNPDDTMKAMNQLGTNNMAFRSSLVATKKLAVAIPVAAAALAAFTSCEKEDIADKQIPNINVSQQLSDSTVVNQNVVVNNNLSLEDYAMAILALRDAIDNLTEQQKISDAEAKAQRDIIIQLLTKGNKTQEDIKAGVSVIASQFNLFKSTLLKMLADHFNSEEKAQEYMNQKLEEVAKNQKSVEEVVSDILNEVTDIKGILKDANLSVALKNIQAELNALYKQGQISKADFDKKMAEITKLLAQIGKSTEATNQSVQEFAKNFDEYKDVLLQALIKHFGNEEKAQAYMNMMLTKINNKEASIEDVVKEILAEVGMIREISEEFLAKFDAYVKKANKWHNEEMAIEYKEYKTLQEMSSKIDSLKDIKVTLDDAEIKEYLKTIIAQNDSALAQNNTLLDDADMQLYYDEQFLKLLNEINEKQGSGSGSSITKAELEAILNNFGDDMFNQFTNYMKNKGFEEIPNTLDEILDAVKKAVAEQKETTDAVKDLKPSLQELKNLLNELLKLKKNDPNYEAKLNEIIEAIKNIKQIFICDCCDNNEGVIDPKKYEDLLGSLDQEELKTIDFIDAAILYQMA